MKKLLYAALSVSAALMLGACAMFASCPEGNAESFAVNNVYGSHMVLQREKPIRIVGTNYSLSPDFNELTGFTEEEGLRDADDPEELKQPRPPPWRSPRGYSGQEYSHRRVPYPSDSEACHRGCRIRP